MKKKMYKKGKFWVVASIAASSFLTGTAVKADETTTATSENNSSSSQTLASSDTEASSSQSAPTTTPVVTSESKTTETKAETADSKTEPVFFVLLQKRTLIQMLSKKQLQHLLM